MSIVVPCQNCRGTGKITLGLTFDEAVELAKYADTVDFPYLYTSHIIKETYNDGTVAWIVIITDRRLGGAQHRITSREQVDNLMVIGEAGEKQHPVQHTGGI